MSKLPQTGAPQAGPKPTTVTPLRIKRSGGRQWMVPAAAQTEGGVDAQNAGPAFRRGGGGRLSVTKATR
jgi:hypothetical protein